jgi:YcxB-like protein
MRIEYEVSEQDYLDGQALAIRNHPSVFCRWSSAIVLGFATLWGLAWIADVLVDGWAAGFRLKNVWLLPVTIYLGLTPLLVRRKRKKLYAKTVSLRGNLYLEVDDARVRCGGPTFNSEVEWANFEKLVEDDKAFVLFLKAQTFVIIPQKFFTPEQLTEFRAYCQRHLPSK